MGFLLYNPDNIGVWRILSAVREDYKKGSLLEIQKHRELACARTKTLHEFENPCASLYPLIELFSIQNPEV
jgi:hypothetical protein